jgi:hypothetical protein
MEAPNMKPQPLRPSQAQALSPKIVETSPLLFLLRLSKTASRLEGPAELILKAGQGPRADQGFDKPGTP